MAIGVVAFAAPTVAELTARGDLFVRFSGGIEPGDGRTLSSTLTRSCTVRGG